MSYIHWNHITPNLIVKVYEFDREQTYLINRYGVIINP